MFVFFIFIRVEIGLLVIYNQTYIKRN